MKMRLKCATGEIDGEKRISFSLEELRLMVNDLDQNDEVAAVVCEFLKKLERELLEI